MAAAAQRGGTHMDSVSLAESPAAAACRWRSAVRWLGVSGPTWLPEEESEPAGRASAWPCEVWPCRAWPWGAWCGGAAAAAAAAAAMRRQTGPPPARASSLHSSEQ